MILAYVRNEQSSRSKRTFARSTDFRGLMVDSELITMKYNLPFILAISILGFAITSCEKEKKYANTPIDPGLKGVFCLNEGAFQAGNAEVSYYPSSGGTGVRNLYFEANALPLGDVLQSMTIHNGEAYLCVNNSQKIEVVDTETFKRIGTISGIRGPRYFLVIDSTHAVVSDWYSDQLFKVNLTTLSVVDSISCGSGPEQMVLSNGKIFVCNSGGFITDSSISVIDAVSLGLVSTIATGVNPAYITKDSNGKILVLCRGSLGDDYTPTPDDAGGKLLRIDPVTLQGEAAYDFAYDEHPLHLQLSDNRIYFLNGSWYYTGKIQWIDAQDWSQGPTTLVEREFYSLGVHPQTQNIYAGKASFSSNTHVVRFAPNGTLIDSLPAGIAPNGFVFNL